MIPVLATPVLDRYDLLEGMEASVDAEVKRYYVIDNGGKYDPFRQEPSWAEKRHVCDPGANLGFGASVNLAIKANLMASWWLFVNDDIAFGPGDLRSMEERMQLSGSDPLIATMKDCGFAAFAINEAAVELAGWFDENYHPAYCEDCDIEWRAKRKGVKFAEIPGATRHLGSQTINGNRKRKDENNRTYPLNVKYHREKWGGDPRQEVYETPYNQGGDSFLTTAPRLSRLRELVW